MRPNLTAYRKAVLRARVGWVRDVLRELLSERYRDFQRQEAAASNFKELPRDCRNAIRQAEVLKTDRSERPVPFVEAANNLVRAVLEADYGERQVEPFASVAQRARSWESFKRAAQQWCDRHRER